MSFGYSGASAAIAPRAMKPCRGLYRPARWLSLLALATATFALTAAPGYAGTVTNERPLIRTFNGSDTTAGRFNTILTIGVDESTGALYVVDTGKNVVDKFNTDGEAQDFSALGSSSLTGSATPDGSFGFQSGFNFADISVDNSGGPNQGRLYVSKQNGGLATFHPVDAFSSTGSFLWRLPPSAAEDNSLFGENCGTGVDTQGHLWVGDDGANKALEFANAGSPPAKIDEVSATAGSGDVCRLNLDAEGHLYMVLRNSQVDKYVGGTFSSTLDPTASQDIAIDQSSVTGHLFTIHEANFNEYDSLGTLVKTYGNEGSVIGDGRGIAYNKALDRVYVADQASNTVKVFGSPASGIVPNVTCATTTEIGIDKAKANCEINPESVPNTFHFEWKVGTGESWGAAVSQPLPFPSIEPTDSSSHAVSFNITDLKGNTTYQVRLVGTNVANGLNAYSSPSTFTTLTAPAPTVSIDPASAITSTSAHISGTIDPKTDQTAWRVLEKAVPHATQSDCEALADSGSGFETAKEATIPSGEPGVAAVAADLTGLLPAQSYCVRIVATNSGGTARATTDFSTLATVPDEIETAFAAPRAETAARINGYVNPEGEDDFKYQFEFSADGTTWTPLALHESSIDARGPVIVSDELTGLAPGTTYHYRFGLMENSAGAATSLGLERTFTTRTTGEMELPQRGVELVNNPDKGNQHIHFEEFKSGERTVVRTDGNELVWTVASGAPGGTAGSSNTFLATRSSDGWNSRALIPPAAQQVGEGSLKYQPEFASSDFKNFIFRTEEEGLFFGENPQSTYVRLDDEQHQEVLAHFDANLQSTRVDATADTMHVIHTREDTNVLEDIGTGTPTVVGLMSDESPPSCGIQHDTEFAGSASTYGYPGYHWIASTDASRVYFLTKGSDCSGPEGLYVRNRESDTTTQIAQSASFIRDTFDGRSAFFTTTEKLANNDLNSDQDIYQWDENAGVSGEAICLTCVVTDANVSSVPGNVRISDDFSHIYFMSTNQLLPNFGQQGSLNLYVLSGDALRFVASLPNADPNAPTFLASFASMQMSSDGNVMAFLSTERLTTDQISSSCTESFGQPIRCPELYRYDDRDGSIECVSCFHLGLTSAEATTGNSDGGLTFWLSSDGSTIAFATAQALFDGDVNGGPDVYEWRNGTPGLITDGETEFPSSGLTSPTVAGIDTDGSNIFFLVAEPGLTGYEHDGVDNVYDARVGGGFPRPTPPLHCSEESCQGPLQEAPTFEQPGSTGVGRGNVVSRHRHCRRGSVRRHRRCTKRRGHHKRRHRARKTTASTLGGHQ